MGRFQSTCRKAMPFLGLALKRAMPCWKPFLYAFQDSSSCASGALSALAKAACSSGSCHIIQNIIPCSQALTSSNIHRQKTRMSLSEARKPSHVCSAHHVGYGHETLSSSAPESSQGALPPHGSGALCIAQD
jgi:hypothetical protein